MCVRTVAETLRVCIVGAGPAGLYTAERLLKRFRTRVLHIDVLDRLPFPFGLVETGVAPDHPETKNVRSTFTRVLQNPQCHFYGSVSLGRDVSLVELKDLYHACVLAYGAEGERKLGVLGEEGKGVLNGNSFVWWYNDHPDCRSLDIDLSNVEDVAIVGAGNVALDCARILLKDWRTFQKSDMALHAIAALKRSAVKRVHVIARKSVAHVKFTPKELREIMGIPRVQKNVNVDDLKISDRDAAAVAKLRTRKRTLGVFEDAVKQQYEARFNEEPHDREIFFLFNKCVQKIQLSDMGSISGLSLRTTHPDHAFKAAERKAENMKTDLLIKCIGSKTIRVSGVPFDPISGVIPNTDGRVTDGKEGKVQEGLYVAGWAKRGSSGIIGTNILDAEDVTNAICEDLKTAQLRVAEPWTPLAELLSEKGVSHVPFGHHDVLRSTSENIKNVEN